ncbi:hypothetical protein SEA_JINKIES_77 [Arthrobacter phage Jinkies]|uniref:Uncharacterized protein n=1 Tax=Arthrobacter phage Jinkies TaxID=2743903 RepID=A0A7T0IFJ6_9CAUD|nr:hypothetical protein SEA_JINKIES_77 [Arthrobacter phage Jinkies]
MTKTSEEALIAILIEKLGGEVTITHEDFYRADELEVTRWDEPAKLSYRLTAARPPVTLDGEIVPDEPKAIEPKQLPTAHQCEDWMLVFPIDSAPYCAGCGSHVA